MWPQVVTEENTEGALKVRVFLGGISYLTTVLENKPNNDAKYCAGYTLVRGRISVPSVAKHSYRLQV